MKNLSYIAVVMGCVLGCSGAPIDTDGGRIPGSDGGRDAGAPLLDGGAADASTTPDGGLPEADGGVPDPDAGEPPVTLACNDDGTCGASETCASCASDCGSCDVEALSSRRARYLDGACAQMGDGLSDTCASSAGASGRFNALQPALDALVAGDTLYVHPGDYWRDIRGTLGGGATDSGGTFTMDGVGTAERPIVVTARFRDRQPVIHSCDPDDPDLCPAAAIASYGDFVIWDHLQIRGRIQLWGGERQTMQYLECTRGWGVGDGNTSCLRIESCTDCLAHHNHVHSLEGGTEDPADRTCGLKEFTSEGTIWEFNTVLDAPYHAYDLHRNSVGTTVRFNFFSGSPGSTVVATRSRMLSFYGNVFEGPPSGTLNCIWFWGRDESAPSAPHGVEVHHNTCLRAQGGFVVVDDVPAIIADNIVAELTSRGEPTRNVVIESDDSDADHNAYDAAGEYRRVEYDGPEYDDLSSWRTATGWDAASRAAANGACTVSDGHPVEAECLTMARDGGEVGAYGATSCVGHTCP